MALFRNYFVCIFLFIKYFRIALEVTLNAWSFWNTVKCLIENKLHFLVVIFFLPINWFIWVSLLCQWYCLDIIQRNWNRLTFHLHFKDLFLKCAIQKSLLIFFNITEATTNEEWIMVSGWTSSLFRYSSNYCSNLRKIWIL